MLENCFLSFSGSKSSYMKWCSFSYGCYKTSSQDHPIGLEKFCLQEHNPDWYPISEVDGHRTVSNWNTELNTGRENDRQCIFFNVPKCTLEKFGKWLIPQADKSFMTLPRKVMWDGEIWLFYSNLYYHSWDIRWKKDTSTFLQKINESEIQSPSSTLICFWDKKKCVFIVNLLFIGKNFQLQILCSY